MTGLLNKLLGFLKGETVLCAAVVLAVISAFLVPPSWDYVGYIDWDTLALLFSLMAVMKGFQQAGVFVSLGSRLLGRVNTTRTMLLVLVFLPFALSMVMTNDVSLITFVPFGMVVLKMAGQESLMIPMVVLQTVAANLGSMLTPMGNPQNLYLYAQSGMGFFQFCQLMLPYVLLSGICLAAMILFRRSQPVQVASLEHKVQNPKEVIWCCVGFVLCLLRLFNLIPPLAIAAVTAVFLLIFNRPLLAKVDYSLLLTFIAFFVFIGNVGAMEEFQSFLTSVLSGYEEIVSVLASQIISNVPAALLLSGFSQQWSGLIVGCNLGGLGTLIASMASLISYKQVAREYPEKKGKYFLWFTLCNVGMLAILLLESWLLGQF